MEFLPDVNQNINITDLAIAQGKAWVETEEGRHWLVQNNWRKYAPLRGVRSGKFHCHSVLKYAILNMRAHRGLLHNKDHPMPSDGKCSGSNHVCCKIKCECLDTHTNECISGWCKCKWWIDTPFMTDQEMELAQTCRKFILGRPKGAKMRRMLFMHMMASPPDMTRQRRPHCDQTYKDAFIYMVTKDTLPAPKIVEVPMTSEVASLPDGEIHFIPDRNF